MSPVFSTIYNWLVTTKLLYGRKYDKNGNSKFQVDHLGTILFQINGEECPWLNKHFPCCQLMAWKDLTPWWAIKELNQGRLSFVLVYKEIRYICWPRTRLPCCCASDSELTCLLSLPTWNAAAKLTSLMCCGVSYFCHFQPFIRLNVWMRLKK